MNTEVQSVSPWVAMIPVLVPVVVALVKTTLPKIPSVWLPVLAPLLGAGADIALCYAGQSTLGPLWGAALGSAGVGLREVADQARKALKGGGQALGVLLVGLLVMSGCRGSLTTQAFRAEETAVNTVFTAYVGWTNYYHFATNGASAEELAKLERAREQIKEARLQFAAAASVVEGLRYQFERFSRVEPQLQAALDTLTVQGSNVVWLVGYYTGGVKKEK